MGVNCFTTIEPSENHDSYLLPFWLSPSTSLRRALSKPVLRCRSGPVPTRTCTSIVRQAHDQANGDVVMICGNINWFASKPASNVREGSPVHFARSGRSRQHSMEIARMGHEIPQQRRQIAQVACNEMRHLTLPLQRAVHREQACAQ